MDLCSIFTNVRLDFCLNDKNTHNNNVADDKMPLLVYSMYTATAMAMATSSTTRNI